MDSLTAKLRCIPHYSPVGAFDPLHKADVVPDSRSEGFQPALGVQRCPNLQIATITESVHGTKRKCHRRLATSDFGRLTDIRWLRSAFSRFRSVLGGGADIKIVVADFR